MRFESIDEGLVGAKRLLVKVVTKYGQTFFLRGMDTSAAVTTTPYGVIFLAFLLFRLRGLTPHATSGFHFFGVLQLPALGRSGRAEYETRGFHRNSGAERGTKYSVRSTVQ